MAYESPTGVSAKKEKPDALLQRILTDFETAKTARQPREEKWIEYDELFRSLNPEKPEDGLANLFIPEVEMTVRTLQIRLCSPFKNATEPFISAIPREPNDQGTAKAGESLLFYQFQQTKFGKRVATWALQMLKYDGSPVLVDWEYELQEVESEQQIFNPETLQEETIKVKDYVVKKDGPRFQPFSIWDWYIDPEATCMQDARYGIRRLMVSEEHLLSMEAMGRYKKVKEVIAQGGSGDAEGGKPATLDDEADYECYKEHELLEYWDNIKKRLYVVANRRTIIRNDKNPFPHQRIPVVFATYKEHEFEFYGSGAVESIEGLQDELNLKRNQRADYVTRVLNPMWLMMRGTVADPDELESRPGGIIQCNDIDGLKPVEIPLIAFNPQEEQILKGEMQNASALSDYSQGRGGTPKQTRETATEVLKKSEAGNTAFDFYFKQFSEFIAEVAEMFASMNQEFLDDDTLVRILGDEGNEFVRVSSQDIAGEYDFFCVVDPQKTADGVKLQQAMQAYNLFGKDPDFNGRQMKMEIIKLLGFKNVEKYMVPVQPPMQPPGAMPGQGGLPPELEQALAGVPPEVRPFVLAQLQGQGGQPPQGMPPGQQGPIMPPQQLEKVPTGAMPGNLMGGNMMQPQ